ncbi:MAG: hypothetical protein MUC34_21165 [Anaerolineae bacterium]|nr:hypothetical protein [Anaerolineae bacterium]
MPRALKTVASTAAVAASLTGLMLAPALKDLIKRQPTGARGIVSLEGAYRLCKKTNLQGWELVDFVTELVHAKFRTYSVRNLWDTPALAFKYGMGYCTQYNLALAQLLRRLGFAVQPVLWATPGSRSATTAKPATFARATLKTKRGRWISAPCPKSIPARPQRSSPPISASSGMPAPSSGRPCSPDRPAPPGCGSPADARRLR